MKYLIWGTGYQANVIYEANSDRFKDWNIEIVGFIDNHRKDDNFFFHGIKVYLPAQIQGLDYDYIDIWVIEPALSEIKKQIEDELCIGHKVRNLFQDELERLFLQYKNKDVYERPSSELFSICVDYHRSHQWYKNTYKYFEHQKRAYYVYEWLSENVSKDKKIADIACGAGEILFFLQQEGFHNLSGFDIDSTSISAAKELDRITHGQVNFFLDDAVNPQFKECFDVFTWMTGMYLLEGYSLDVFFRTFVPRLNAGGYLIFEMVDSSFNDMPMNEYFTPDWNKEGRKRPSEYLLRMSQDEVCTCAEKYELSFIKSFSVNARVPFKIYIFQKRKCEVPKVSVIVPVYNVELYLNQCMDSIIHQTLREIEIICVDDGSTDQSGKILDKYSGTDTRIKVIHKENSGYGAAMNEGLRQASGEYIGIVESDDKIAPQMYEVLYQEAKDKNLDLVKGEAYFWFEKLDYVKRVHESGAEGYFNRTLKGVDRNVFFDFFMNIWSGIYNRKFLFENNIWFNETPGASYQDNGFWMQTCLYAKRAMWMDEAYYYYRQDNPEASVKSTSKMMTMTNEYDYLESLLKERRQESLLPYCYYMKLFRLKSTFYRVADEYKQSFCAQIRDDYDKFKPYIKGCNSIDRWICELLKDPVRYCKSVIEKKRELKDAILKSESLIIYGAGRFGDKVMRILYNEGLYDKISCFAVSKATDIGRIAGKSILLIDGALKKYPNAIVIIATMKGSKAYEDMTFELSRLGVLNRIDSKDLIDNFYVL